MKTQLKRLAAWLAMSLAPMCLAQMPSSPTPWQSVVDQAAVQAVPQHPDKITEMTALEYRGRRWHVPLVVEKADQTDGAFCHGSVIREGWVLTAASCVCSTKPTTQGMEVVLERRTDTELGKRVRIDRVWLLQDGPGALPAACVVDASKLPPGISASSRDLALVQLPRDSSGPPDLKSEPLDRAQIDMLGTTEAPSSILFDLVDPTAGPDPRNLKAESVVLAGRPASTTAGEKYRVNGPFVLDLKAQLGQSCALPLKEIATVASPVPGSTTTFVLCADMALNPSQSLGGTGVVMADHRRPLLLGLRSQDKEFIPLWETVAGGEAITIAQSMLEFIKSMDDTGKPPASSVAHWFALDVQPAVPEPSPQCRPAYLKTVGGVEIYSYAVIPRVGTAYVFRQPNVWIDVRGAPKAYQRDDKNALDTLMHAGYPDGRWRQVLARESDSDTEPYSHPEGTLEDYFVSMTTLRDRTFSRIDLRRYVDAATIPYIAFDYEWANRNNEAIAGKIGDFAVAVALEKDSSGRLVASKKSIGGIVADVREGPLGGISLALAKLLDSDQNRELSAITGVKPPMDVMFMVFPRTGTGVYAGEGAEEIRKVGDGLLRRAGGWPDPSCLHK